MRWTDKAGIYTEFSMIYLRQFISNKVCYLMPATVSSICHQSSLSRKTGIKYGVRMSSQQRGRDCRQKAESFLENTDRTIDEKK